MGKKKDIGENTRRQVTLLRGDRATKSTSTAIFVKDECRVLNTSVSMASEEVRPGAEAETVVTVIASSLSFVACCALPFLCLLCHCLHLLLPWVFRPVQVTDWDSEPVPNASVCVVAVDQVENLSLPFVAYVFV